MDDEIPQVFRSAMRRLATTVSIVTCAGAEGWHGMTATAVTSVCADPPTLLVCVNRATSLYRPLVTGGAFCVNLLRSSQAPLSRAFGGQVKGPARFALGNWQAEEGGLPFLADAQANLFCAVQRVVECCTHGIVLGGVRAVRFAEAVTPLLWQDGHYVVTCPLAEAGA